MARAHLSPPPDPLDRLVGEAPALQALRARIRHLARFDAVGQAAVPTVLLQGETGTGKGLAARVVHDSGPRASGPFIEVNCAAIPDTLLEAELFGVEAGAFTDAKRAKPGLFEAASGGTLFLDEIEALPLPLQGKCLTAIETKRMRRLGAVAEHATDVKLIATTPVALSRQVQAGRFRADLYHRLAVVVLALPPLRERGDDILVLARVFLQRYGAAYGVGPQRLSKAAETWLVDYHWPGNVRELSHLLERVALLEAATVIDPETLERLCLPQPVPEAPAVSAGTASPGEPLHEAESLADALRQSRGNVAQAARLLGMSRGGLRHRLRKYGLDRTLLHRSLPLAGDEAGGTDTPPASTLHFTRSLARQEAPPGLPSPQEGEGQGERMSARRDEWPVGLTRGASLTPADGAESVAEKVHGSLRAVGITPDDWAPYLLHLLGGWAGTERLADVSPESLKAKTFEALRQMVLHHSQQQPLVIAVENLHWIDPTSEEWFASLVERLPGAAILFLATYRPGYHPPWLDKSYATQLTLPPLSPQDSVQVLRAILPTNTVPAPLAQTILAKAQGNPFFLEEIVQTLVDQGMQGRTSGGTLPVAMQLPPTIQGVLAARIDRLSPDEKVLLQTLAVLGHVCSRRVLMRVVAESEAEVLQQLTDLQAAELIYEPPTAPEPTVVFKHVLTQEVAYHSLAQAQQLVLHERTAQAIEGLVGERLAEHYGELAHHYSCSGNTQKAVAYLQRAGQQAKDRSAYREAIMHLTQGLELLPSLPESPERNRHEIDIQITFGEALIVTKGRASPDAEQAFTRARELCQQSGETPQLFTVLAGLRMISEARGELPKARELAEQLLSIAQHAQYPARLMRAHNVLGATLLYLGVFAQARVSLEQGIALDALPRDRAAAARLSDHIQGDSIIEVSCRRHAALTLWFLGYPEQGLERSHEAIALAQALAHPYSLVYALYQGAILHCLRREAPTAQAQAEALIELARQQEFLDRVVRGIVLRGWALSEQGQSTEGIAQMRQGMDAHRSMGTMMRPYDLALLAEAYRRIGRTAEALRLLGEALSLIRKFGGYFYQAEVYRLTGEVRLQQGADGDVSGSPPPDLWMRSGHEGEAPGPSPRPTEAETWFRQALDVAHRQQAKSLELRAAMSLSRLWQGQGRRAEAYQLLAPIYGWFTEGFDTADLQDAKALSEALA